MTVSFTLPLPPITCPRPRVRSKPFTAAYYPANYTKWQKEAARLLAEIDGPKAPLAGAVSMSVVFNVEKARTSKLLHPRGDIDNYCKAIMDAITKDGRFWDDDVQVTLLNATKRFVPHGTPGSIQVTLNEL